MNTNTTTARNTKHAVIVSLAIALVAALMCALILKGLIAPKAYADLTKNDLEGRKIEWALEAPKEYDVIIATKAVTYQNEIVLEYVTKGDDPVTHIFMGQRVTEAGYSEGDTVLVYLTFIDD